VNDGIASDVSDSSTSVVTTAAPHPASITGTIGDQKVTVNSTTNTPFAAVTITNVDIGPLMFHMTVKLNPKNNGNFAAPNRFKSDPSGDGVYFDGNAKDASTAIKALIFHPTNPGRTTFTIEVNPGDSRLKVTDSKTVVEAIPAP